MTRPAARDTVTTHDCGFRSPRTAAGLAAHALRMHKCERWHAKAASAARGHARKALVDRTPKLCVHKRAAHRHGTYAAYVLDACRCAQCSAANSAYESHRVRQVAYGRSNLIDSAPVLAHVRELGERGMGLKRIAAAAGVSYSTLGRLVYGLANRAPSTRVRKKTAERILAVQWATASVTRVNGASTRDQLRGLIARGWSQSKLAVRLGVLPSNFNRMLHGERTQVNHATAVAVRALADELCDQLPPQGNHRDRIAASRARNYAAARGWTAALLWGDTDESAADVDVIDEVAVRRACAGEFVQLTRAERVEACRQMKATGVVPSVIAKRLRVSGATLRQLLELVAS